MTRNRNDPWFGWVVIVPMTSPNPDDPPAVGLDKLDCISDLHPKLFRVSFCAKCPGTGGKRANSGGVSTRANNLIALIVRFADSRAADAVLRR